MGDSLRWFNVPLRALIAPAVLRALEHDFPPEVIAATWSTTLERANSELETISQRRPSADNSCCAWPRSR